MDEPDYSRCSLHELVDVARRINRGRYPQRYARVLNEIETRQNAPDFVTAPRHASVRTLIIWLIVEWIPLIGFGIIEPIAYYYFPNSPPIDMPMYLLLVPLSLLLMLLCASGFGLMFWALRSVEDRELVLRNSLKAVLWAPLFLPLGLIMDFTIRFDRRNAVVETVAAVGCRRTSMNAHAFASDRNVKEHFYD